VEALPVSDTAKTIDMKRVDVRKLAAEFPSVPQVTPVAVNNFVLRLHAEGLSPATLKKTISAWRGYWQFLKGNASATRSSAGPSYGLPGQPATPRTASQKVVWFYSAQLV
jgi:site-specific recombinase XerC